MKKYLFLCLAAACLLLTVGTATAAMNTCIAPDNGLGTVDLPPIYCLYSPANATAYYHMIKDQVTGEELMRLRMRHRGFTNVQVSTGGRFGGEIEAFDSVARIDIEGVGALAGFQRTIDVPMVVETHTAPREAGEPIQSFDTEMARLEGEILGDQDFALLRISAGRLLEFPESLGHTTLTEQTDETFVVDSFFDVEYHIDYAGTSTGALNGLSGTSDGTVKVTAFADDTTNPPPGITE